MFNKKNSRLMVSVVLAATFSIIAVLSNAAFAAQPDELEQIDEISGAQDSPVPYPDSNQICPECFNGSGIFSGIQSAQGVTAGIDKLTFNQTFKGGYVAGGTGLMNRGWGTILIQDIPAGSTTRKAYLYWSVIGPNVKTPPAYYAIGKINGVAITGIFMGNVTLGAGQSIYAYRADVTAKVPAGVLGNKPYHLADFASGKVWGDDPWISGPGDPYILGASMVIVYNNLKYPSTNIQIRDGIQLNEGSPQTKTFIGFRASSLPIAKTTYIFSFGTKANEEAVSFNGVAMPSYFLDGTDRQNGINFTYGNLHDTNTAYVKVTPGSTSASATVISYGDPLIWLAQVFSIYDGNVDTDGDALRDSWEIFGYDYDSNGIIDVDLPALGADPFHKDIFVEVDYMGIGPGEAQSHNPHPLVKLISISTFKNAPYAKNPDGKNGINIHIEVDDQVPHDSDLNPVWTEVNAIKAAYFPVARQFTHHYALFAHGFDGTTSSGISNGIPANDFIVTLGTWPTNPGTPDEQTGTFIHELGHNLGLTHGGNDHLNYKPNYLSIMNYWFQSTGLYRNGSWGHFDYQRTTPYPLNENGLNEAAGIGAVSAGYGTNWVYRCTYGVTTTKHMPIDWNLNRAITSLVSEDINCDGKKTTLGSQNNWQNINYNGTTIGDLTNGRSSIARVQIMTPDQMPPELTYEENERIKKLRSNATTQAVPWK